MLSVAIMLNNRLFRSRRFLLLLGLVTFVLVTTCFYFKSSLIGNSLHNDRIYKERDIVQTIIEINDREPSYRLSIYKGYQLPLDRNRAQAKLIDNLKLHDKCQQNSNTIVVDVGAALGEFGLYAAACGCQVYMFEVEPMKVSLIKTSIQLNSLELRVNLITKAVSDLPPKSKIYFSLNGSNQVSSSSNLNSSDMYSVETIRLNDFNFSSSIYLLKVDVGGYEAHVFRSSERLFREHLVHHVIFQYAPWKSDGMVKQDLLAYIKDILDGKKFYALHPREATIYGPLYNEDIHQFFSQHLSQRLERDVYVQFQDEDLTISSKTYAFKSSFD